MAGLCRADFRKNTFNPSSVVSAQTARDNLCTFLLLNIHVWVFLNAYLWKNTIISILYLYQLTCEIRVSLHKLCNFVKWCI